MLLVSQPLPPEQPLSFAKVRYGVLLMTNGLGRPWAWDGTTAFAFPAGVLPPDAPPAIAQLGGGQIGIGTYSCYYRFVDRWGNPSNLSPVSVEHVAASGRKFQWNVGTSSEWRVVKRELWRTLSGDNRVVYLVGTIHDNTSTVLEEGFSDDQLKVQALENPATAMALQEKVFGRPFANRFTVPPDHMAVCALFQDRSFWGVDVAYRKGAVNVVNGSTAVTGIGTKWPPALAGRWLFVRGGGEPQRIASVVSETQIELETAYSGNSQAGASYAIRSNMSERNKLYYSSADYPEGVPVTNTVTLQENTGDDDEVTALMPHGSWLYVFKDRHTYRLSFVRQPEIDTAVHLHSFRGCLHQRCWDRVEDTAYVADELGPYRMGEGGAIDPIGAVVQPQWREMLAAGGRSFVLADLERTVVRFVVGDTALCYHYFSKAWWQERYPWPLGAGVRRGTGWSLHGGAAQHRVYRFAGSKLDVVSAGTTRGTATGGSDTTLVDASASFSPTAMGAPLWLIAGTGAGQMRLIVGVTATTLTVSPAWAVPPDSTTQYQVGGIECVYRGPKFPFVPADVTNERQFRLWYRPGDEGWVDLYRWVNWRSEPEALPYTQHDIGEGYEFREGDRYVRIGLAKAGPGGQEVQGLAAVRFAGRFSDSSDAERYIQYGLRGVAGPSGISIHAMELIGVVGREME